MILLRKAYRGHYIEIRPVAPSTQREPGGQACIWIDGEPLAPAFPCSTAGMLPALLKVAMDTVDTGTPIRA